MNMTHDIGLNPADLAQLLRKHFRLWAIPTVACVVVAASYALLSPREWRATQSLIVRAEAAGVSDQPIGEFSDLSEMKTLQETILALAKSHSVIQATLEAVGPPGDYDRPNQWPTLTDVEDFREQLDMRPPGGAEFGKTEVFYLSVLDTNRQRAGRLVAALCDQLQVRMQQLRDERARGMIAELERTVALADEDLAKNTKCLSMFEANVGADLAELRNLNATVGGQGAISQELQAIKAERRANEAQRREDVQLLALLQAAKADPLKLIATPNSLLRSQPAVSQLKNALVDAQIRKANLLGSRSQRHPLVIAASQAEQLVQEQLHKEIAIAIEGVQVDLKLCADRDEGLHAKWLAASERLAGLAKYRAEYANLVASVDNYAKLVEAARNNLADARARQAAAWSGSMISRIDGVDTGVRPVGPGRTTITAAGGMGGLLLGFGLVFLIAAPAPANSSVAPLFVPSTVSGVRSNGSKNQDAAVQPTTTPGNFGLFRGLTLDEAIRSVEGRQSTRNAR
jgi:polysaccharide biosynthesis transport protein